MSPEAESQPDPRLGLQEKLFAILAARARDAATKIEHEDGRFMAYKLKSVSVWAVVMLREIAAVTSGPSPSGDLLMALIGILSCPHNLPEHESTAGCPCGKLPEVKVWTPAGA